LNKKKKKNKKKETNSLLPKARKGVRGYAYKVGGRERGALGAAPKCLSGKGIATAVNLKIGGENRREIRRENHRENHRENLDFTPIV